MAVQHGVDNMAAIGAQHAAVIAHRFAGGALDQAVDGAGSQLAEQAILTILPYRTHHVVPFVGFGDQPGISSGGFCRSASSVMTKSPSRG